jgi:hypothetical protein
MAASTKLAALTVAASLLLSAALGLMLRDVGHVARLPTVAAPPRSAHASTGRPELAGLLSLPRAAQGPISRALGEREGSYGWRRGLAGTLTAVNQAQGLRVSVDGGVVSVATGPAGRLSFVLSTLGRPGRMARAAPFAAAISSNRLSLRSHRLTAWYVNGPLGLEQGFVVGQRPGSGSGPLTLAVRVGGTLRPSLTSAAAGVSFRDRAGRQILRYVGLQAHDAGGRSLPAWIGLSGHTLLIHVRDDGARYPLTIDPFVQSAELTTSNGSANDRLGWSVAISASGSTIAVGAPNHKVGSSAYQGMVYVFSEPSGGWQTGTETAQLSASDGAADDQLGQSVAISDSGQTVVAGAPGHGAGQGAGQGAVYVFSTSSAWQTGQQTAELSAKDGAAGDELGWSVATSSSGEVIVAGAPMHTPPTPSGQQSEPANAGALYVFVSSGAWQDGTQNAELTASDPNSKGDDLLGSGVAISPSGATIVGGASNHAANGGESNQGAVYVFIEPSTGWSDDTSPGASGSHNVELTASDATTNDALGASVAISGTTIVAGAPDHQVGSNPNQGAVYVYSEPSSGWQTGNETAELTASDGNEGDHLGYAVAALDNGSIVVGGAPDHADAAGSDQGALYFYSEPSTGWQATIETAKLEATDANSGDQFGWSVAASPTTIVTGAPVRSVGSASAQGTAYVLGTPTVAITPGSGAFASTPVGATSTPISFSVQNSGASDLTIPSSAATLTGADAGQYTIQSDGCSGRSIAPGTSCQIAVAFSPKAVGAHNSAALEIKDNAPDSPESVALSGTATPPLAPPPAALALLNLHQSHAIWGEPRVKAHTRRARKRAIPRVAIGTTFSFTLTAPARVYFAFYQLLPGARSAQGCVALSAAPRGSARCTREVLRGTLSLSTGKGRHRLRFDGWLAGRWLKPGAYSLLVGAVDSAHHVSKLQGLTFRILGNRKA